MKNRNARTVTVTLAPENLEFPNGDILDETLLCVALTEYLTARYPGAEIEVGVSGSQGHESYLVNGRRDDELRDTCLEFDYTDESLYAPEEPTA